MSFNYDVVNASEYIQIQQIGKYLLQKPRYKLHAKQNT